MSGGIVRPGAGTPWWTQNSGNGSGYGNGTTLANSAPVGYTYDPVQLKYVPTTASASNSLEEQNRRRLQEDRLNTEAENDYQTSRANAQTDRQRQLSTEDANNSRQAGLYGRLDTALGGIQSQINAGSNPTSFGPAPQVTAPQTVANPSTIAYGGGENGPNLSMAVDKAASAAQEAAFGKAKATAGSLGQSAVNSLRSNLAERGLVGGGSETRGITDRLAAATNPLSDINAAQLSENANTARHNQDLGAQAAQTAYQGGIAQRGQDIGANNANADRSLAAATGNANRTSEAQLATASLAQQKQLALQQMMQSALSGIVAANGRRY